MRNWFVMIVNGEGIWGFGMMVRKEAIRWRRGRTFEPGHVFVRISCFEMSILMREVGESCEEREQCS